MAVVGTAVVAVTADADNFGVGGLTKTETGCIV